MSESLATVTDPQELEMLELFRELYALNPEHALAELAELGASAAPVRS